MSTKALIRLNTQDWVPCGVRLTVKGNSQQIGANFDRLKLGKFTDKAGVSIIKPFT